MTLFEILNFQPFGIGVTLIHIILIGLVTAGALDILFEYLKEKGFEI